MNNIVIVSREEMWSKYAWKRLEKENKVKIIDDFFLFKSRFSQLIFRIGTSHKLGFLGFNYFQLLFTKEIEKKLQLDVDSNANILVYHVSGGFRCCKLFKHLKKKYQNLKIAYVFTNVVDKSFPKNTHRIVSLIKDTFDYVFAFDKRDVTKYGLDFSYLVFEPEQIQKKEEENDVFLVAKAKDRLTEILNIYNKCINDKLKIEFYVNALSQKDYAFVEKFNIHPNQVLSYEEVISQVLKTKCIVDIMQKNSQGVTLNVVEGIIFNKKIISNNVNLINEPFYDPSRIYIIGDRKDSIKSFLETPIKDYKAEEKKLFSGPF